MKESHSVFESLINSLIKEQGLVLLKETKEETFAGPNRITTALVYRPNAPWLDWPPHILLSPGKGLWKAPGEYSQYGRAYIAIVIANKRGTGLHLVQVEDIDELFLPITYAVQGSLHDHLSVSRTIAIKKLSSALFACQDIDPVSGRLTVRGDNQCDFDRMEKEYAETIANKLNALRASSAQYECMCDLYLAIPDGELPSVIPSSLLELSVSPVKYAVGNAWRLRITNSTMTVMDGVLHGHPRNSRSDGVTAELSLQNTARIIGSCKELADAWMDGSIPAALGMEPLDYTNPLVELIKADLAASAPM